VIVIVLFLLVLVLVLAVALTRPAAGFWWQAEVAERIADEPGHGMVFLSQASDAETGRQLAERWCSGCHAVEADSRMDQTPAFGTIARDPMKTPEWLRVWLMTPHSTMPDLALSRSDIEAIIVYLKGLGDG
jgi:mono/diheme cytochrome c family protein